jgi:hypothetical protein
MRQPPLNYLVTIVVGALLWVATALFAGQQMGDAVVLQKMTTTQFTQTYQAVVAGAAALGVMGALFWYFYGSREAAAGRLAEARRTWAMLLTGEVVVAVVALLILVFSFRAESLTAANFVEMLVLLLVQTALLFWGATLLCSPRAVEYIPWGRR